MKAQDEDKWKKPGGRFFEEQTTFSAAPDAEMFERICEDYRQAAINHGNHPFVSYKIMAELIRWGWARL